MPRAEKKPANKVGAPEKYTLEFCVAEMKRFQTLLDADTKWKYIFWQDLVKERPYSKQRISEWRNKFRENDEFSEAIKKIEDELENRLVMLGLRGKANSTLVVFALKNCYKWVDKSEVEQTHKINKLPDIIIQ